ncbi:MAG: enoyl-CoA hydratase [Rickettsiales bacterium]|nr:enoyl-CoA hydratase [Rickettsiales bacterium]
MEKFTSIKYKNVGKVAIIELHIPKTLNALCDILISEINQVLEKIELDSKISVLILKGSEKSFAAGADIAEMEKKEFIDNINNDFIKAWEKISYFKKPIIASVSGYALGGGCEMAMMCDIILASESARFGQPEINLGTIPAAGGTQRLIRSVGKSKAMELILTGRIITAKEAFEAGLVSKVYPVEDLEKQALKLANEIATKSLPVLIMAKHAILSSMETPLTEGIAVERKIFQGTFALNDRKEGMKAFLEKRKPEFNNN